MKQLYQAIASRWQHLSSRISNRRLETFLSSAAHEEEHTLDEDDSSPLSPHLLCALNSADVAVFNFEKWIHETKRNSDKLLCLHDSEYFGNSCFGVNESIYFNGAYMPNYLQNSLAHANKYKHFRSIAEDKVFADRVYVLTHSNAQTYGHFLTECMPKIAVIRCLYLLGYEFPVVISELEPPFIQELLKVMMPDMNTYLISKNQRLLARRAFLINLDNNYVFNRRRFEFISNRAKNVGSDIETNAGERIFISRKNRYNGKSFRTMECDNEIEEIAKEFDFSIVRPEEYNFNEQIGIFGKARVIVGEYGSGMHNAMFSRPHTIVVCLNWINLIQQAIGSVFGHRNYFIFPDSGKPVLAPTERRPGEKLRNEGFRIDVGLFRYLLDQVTKGP